jgi:predicted nucleic acid-binding protein
MQYLLDTNICSRMVRGQSDFFPNAGSRDWASSAISAITAHELEFWAGATGTRRMMALRDFLSTATVVPFDGAAATAAATVRHSLRSKQLSAYDALIAGHALALRCVLVTADADFKRVPGLRTENWLKS